MQSLLLAPVSSFVSVHLYTKYYDGPMKLDKEILTILPASLFAGWLISIVMFVSLGMKRSFLHTFFLLDTTSEFKRKQFIASREDQDDVKGTILKLHPDVYREWIEELPKPWTLKNWSKWEEKKPGETKRVAKRRS